MAQLLIESMESDWDPERYHDTHREKVEALIEEKRSGHEIVIQAGPEPAAKVVDLMEALNASIAAGGPARTPRSTKRAPAAKRAPARRAAPAKKARQGGQAAGPGQARRPPQGLLSLRASARPSRLVVICHHVRIHCTDSRRCAGQTVTLHSDLIRFPAPERPNHGVMLLIEPPLGKGVQMATAQVRVPEERITEWIGVRRPRPADLGRRATDAGLPLLGSGGGRRRRRSCVTSTPTWRSCAGSMPRRWRCSARASWRCGPPCWGRRPPRSGRPVRCGPTTSSSRATGSTASPTAAAWTRSTMLRLWRGTGLSGWDPADFGIATPAIVVGSQALHATGYALGITLDGASSAALAYFGDGATSEGDVAEAFGFAASYMVPVVFFCQNNQWAISEPARLQSHASIAQRGQGYGIPGIEVDGNDVLAVLAATRLALGRAYAGRGPTLIEAVTYRMGPHTTSDDPTRYRTRAEEEEWRVKDPLARLRALLRSEGLADDAVREPRRRCRRGRGRGAAPRLPGHGRSRAGRAVRPCLRGAAPAARRGARGLRGLPGRLRRGVVMADHVARQGAQRRLAPGHGARPEGRLDGRGHREARWRVPGHRGLAARLRRPPCDRHAAGRVRCHRHRRRPGHARLPAGVRDPIRRVRLPGLRPDRLAGGQVALPQRGPGGHAGDHPGALRRRHRRRRAPLRVARGLLRPHGRAARRDAEQRGRRAPHDSAGHRVRRPGRVLRAEAPLLGEGRGRRRRTA